MIKKQQRPISMAGHIHYILVMDTSVERHFQQHFIYRRGGKFYW
jgi:hypothetical protein